MLNPPLPLEEMARLAVKIGLVALLVFGLGRRRAERAIAFEGDEIGSVEEDIDLDNKGPRPFLYVLAHIALRDLAMSNPQLFLQTVSRDGADEFFRSVWNQVLTDVSPDEEIPAETIQCDVHRFEDGQILALINMPKPERITEAFFVAALVNKPGKFFGIIPRRVGCRYFTLELGESDEGERLAIFCEWLKRKQGFTHHNYGPIQPAGGGFVAAIKSIT